MDFLAKALMARQALMAEVAVVALEARMDIFLGITLTAGHTEEVLVRPTTL